MILPPDGWTVAALPAEGPATVPAVKTHLGIQDTTDDAALAGFVDAVNSLLRGDSIPGATPWPCVYGVTADTGWPDSVTVGAVLLAARLFSRRNSPSGVAAFGDLGPVYVSRNDPDVALLLGVGTYAPPVVG